MQNITTATQSKQRIREHVAAVLRSPQFAAAERMRALLAYSVERALEGARDQLKESVIGIQVFGKEPGYDPRLDPTVRVMAGRLRTKLAQYYGANAAPPETQIEYPKGSYVPRFGPPLQLGAAFPSIAVLPFVSLSSNPEDHFFAHGLTDALLTRLAKLPGLRVVSRTPAPISLTDQTIGVNHLLEGSILRDAGRVRIVARLIAQSPERHIWAESYERDLTDILALQNDIAQRAVREICAHLAIPNSFSCNSPKGVDSNAQSTYVSPHQTAYVQRQCRRTGSPVRQDAS